MNVPTVIYLFECLFQTTTPICDTVVNNGRTGILLFGDPSSHYHLYKDVLIKQCRKWRGSLLGMNVRRLLVFGTVDSRQTCSKKKMNTLPVV